MIMRFLISTIAFGIAPFLATAVTPIQPCRIEIVEAGSGWPVPLVELRTTHHQRFVTDNAGVIAMDSPELIGRETWFDVIGQGYEVPKDGFGFRGVRLTPQAGKTLKVEVQRSIIARRIGRLTGGGLFAECQKLGGATDSPDSGVFGCDSVQTAVHRGKMYWAWGDTIVPTYPAGIFDGTSATTAANPLASFEPPLRLRLDYITGPNGTPRGIAKLPGEGPTWVTGYANLLDKSGAERLVCAYMKIKPQMEIYQWGLAVWNDNTNSFEPMRIVWTKSADAPNLPMVPQGHSALWKDDQGKEWMLFGNPLPALRCPATYEAWQDPSTWEVLKPQEGITAEGSGALIKPHSGSISWNRWRKRWVTVFMETLGKPSAYGEIWYAEADEPTGPWGPAVKVLSHDNYTFYNPLLHPEFTPEDSPVLYFEGTYTMQFTKSAQPTPRYDYNQILYRLDLDDPRLAAANHK